MEFYEMLIGLIIFGILMIGLPFIIPNNDNPDLITINNVVCPTCHSEDIKINLEEPKVMRCVCGDCGRKFYLYWGDARNEKMFNKNLGDKNV